MARANERRVFVPCGVIGQHQRPDHRESRRVLREIGRIPLVDEAAVAAGKVEQLDRPADQAVVAGHYAGGQKLQPRVAVVHELLVERTVHVGLVRTHLDAANGNPDHAVQFPVAAIEAALDLVRVSAFIQGQAMQRQRLGGGLDVQQAPAAGPPPERGELLVRSARGQERVGHAAEALAQELVPVALGLPRRRAAIQNCRPVERFGPGPSELVPAPPETSHSG